MQPNTIRRKLTNKFKHMVSWPVVWQQHFIYNKESAVCNNNKIWQKQKQQKTIVQRTNDGHIVCKLEFARAKIYAKSYAVKSPLKSNQKLKVKKKNKEHWSFSDHRNWTNLKIG